MPSDRCHPLAPPPEEAEYAKGGAGKPHAHAHTYATAAVACMLAGREDDARAFANEVRKRNADYSIESFLVAFPNFNERDRETILAPLRELGYA